MTNPDNQIQVAISANVASLVAAMKEAASATGGAATAMREEIASIGAGAKEAYAPLSGFKDVLKDYRSEVRQESRYGRFLAADIASMGIASKSAAGELTQLVSAFAFGGGLGGGIELVKMAVGYFNEVTHSEEEATKQIKQYAIDAAKGITAVREQVDHLIMSLKGASAVDMMWHGN